MPFIILRHTIDRQIMNELMSKSDGNFNLNTVCVVCEHGDSCQTSMLRVQTRVGGKPCGNSLESLLRVYCTSVIYTVVIRANDVILGISLRICGTEPQK